MKPVLVQDSTLAVYTSESFTRYKEQLTQKKAYLATATSAYKKAEQLIHLYEHKVDEASVELVDLEQELSTCEEPERRKQLEEIIQHHHLFIDEAPAKLEPYLAQLDTLSEGIHQLENELTTIIEEVHAKEIAYRASKK